ncbi:MAG: hypothetical protein ABH860_05430 [bacterium]
MKKIVLVLMIITAFPVFCFAGGPISTLKLSDVNISQGAEKPKMVTVDYVFDDLNKLKKHFTCGLGLGGSPMIGFVEKDGFGYPKCEYGITWALGYGYTWISGQPTEAQIKNAIESIRGKNGAFVEEKKIPSMVRDEIGIKSLQYVEFGTVALLVPLNLEMGTMWIWNDNTRTRLGFGLPTLISFGVNLDL